MLAAKSFGFASVYFAAVQRSVRGLKRFCAAPARFSFTRQSAANVLEKVEHHIDLVLQLVHAMFHCAESTFGGGEARFQAAEPQLDGIDAFAHSAYVRLHGADELSQHVHIHVGHRSAPPDPASDHASAPAVNALNQYRNFSAPDEPSLGRAARFTRQKYTERSEGLLPKALA